MSINTTPFLHLPQWQANEKPSFLAEMNQAYTSIDNGYRTIQVAAEGAQTAAENAQNKASEALELGHTNAAGLITLQQGVTQLEADFTDASFVKTIQLEITDKASWISSIGNSYIAYNKYTAFMIIQLSTVAGTYTGISGEGLKMFTITNFPFNFYHLNFFTHLILNNHVVNCYISSSGLVTLNIYSNITFGRDEIIDAMGTLPITSLAAGRTMVENCLYLPTP